MVLKISLVILLTAGLGAVLPVSAQTRRNAANPRPTQLNGQVEDSQGEPVPSAVVQLRDASGGLLATGLTDAQGRFNLDVGSEGPLQIDVSDGEDMETAHVDPASFSNFVMRLPSAHAVRVSPASDTVSLNDLEAPKAAKSKLADAQKAMDRGQLDKAWQLTNAAITAAPHWGKAYLVRGVLNLEHQNYSAAQADLTQSVKENPVNPAALTELGKLYNETGAYNLSDLYLRQALKYPPVLWPTYLEMANLDLVRGRYQEAATMAEDAEYSTPPPPASVHLVAGEAEYGLGHWDKARLELSSYISLAGKNAASTTYIANAQRLLAKMPASNSTAAAAQPASAAH